MDELEKEFFESYDCCCAKCSKGFTAFDISPLLSVVAKACMYVNNSAGGSIVCLTAAYKPK